MTEEHNENIAKKQHARMHKQERSLLERTGVKETFYIPNGVSKEHAKF